LAYEPKLNCDLAIKPDILEGENPIRWSADDRTLFVYRRGELPLKICVKRVNRATRVLERT
jgi:hypothetical protein